MSRAWWIPATAGLCAAVALAPFPEPVRALAAAALVLVLPGLAWARERALVDRIAGAVWRSAVLAVPVVALARGTGADAYGVAAGALGVSLAGIFVATPRLTRSFGNVRFGLAAVLVSLVVTAWSWRDTLARPLDAHWWFAPAETAWEGRDPGRPPGRGGGWAGMQPLGDPEAGAFVLLPRGDHPYLLGPASGPVVLALRGPVGATMKVGSEVVRVESDPTVDPEEGPVPRYQERGVAGVALDLTLAAGEHLPITLSAPDESLVYVLPTPDAVWSLHGSGALRFVHYYQLLNMVEQLRWAEQLGRTRWVTDVQPPWWSWVLAGPLTLTGGGLPTTNVTLLALLLGIGAASVGLLARWAPRAPLLAWLLPALALAEHAKLLYEPGSAGLPDSLYTFAVILAISALGGPASPSYVAAGLGAQLARYPGTLLAALPALLAGRPREAGRLGLAVLVVMGLVGAGGLVSGSLGGWLETAWWETFPEHWHGESDPLVLLARIPAFLLAWLAYTGATPLLALAGWSRPVRVLAASAAAYATLLCTIDHSPSHYFLPLLHLSALACAAAAATARWGWLRVTIATLGTVGLWISIGWVPIEG